VTRGLPLASVRAIGRTLPIYVPTTTLLCPRGEHAVIIRGEPCAECAREATKLATEAHAAYANGGAL
jgi:hypothetical protein